MILLREGIHRTVLMSKRSATSQSSVVDLRVFSLTFACTHPPSHGCLPLHLDRHRNEGRDGEHNARNQEGTIFGLEHVLKNSASLRVEVTSEKSVCKAQPRPFPGVKHPIYTTRFQVPAQYQENVPGFGTRVITSVDRACHFGYKASLTKQPFVQCI